MGLLNRRMVITSLPSPKRRTIRIIHRTIGIGLLIAAVVQVALGASILFPRYEPRGQAFWIVYILLVVLWGVIFGVTEVWRRVRVDLEDMATPLEEDGEGGKGGGMVPIGASTLSREMGLREYPELGEYSWQALDGAIRNGKILVVGNGKYVYDASKWIYSHPGGQIILLAVAGTDISSDYVRFPTLPFQFHT
ncbi:hypothetical protein HK104_008141 [Borealophlyctis nickersoniae]|nr:hypothetical protein HK104_008141 [Borealophlyctis nickersoniae]